MSRQTTYLAQLTDTHVIDPLRHEKQFVDVNGRAAMAVASICAEAPQMGAVLATGDLTNWGRREQYAQLMDLLSPLAIPVLAIPGNHDERTELKLHFPDLPWADAQHASWDITVNDHVRIIGLDSIDPGLDGGNFDSEREAWLDNVLSVPADSAVTHTVLALHHPPFLSGVQWMDESGFQNLDRLVSTIQDSAITQIVCGHLHRPTQAIVAGVPASVGLSTVQHVALDFRDEATVSLIHDPVGYQIHRFHGSQSLTHTRYIDTGVEAFEPPAREPAASAPDGA